MGMDSSRTLIRGSRRPSIFPRCTLQHHVRLTSKTVRQGTTFRLYTIQLRHYLCHSDDRYFVINMIMRVVLLSLLIVSFFVITGILSEGDSLIQPLIFFLLGGILLSALSLAFYARLRSAHRVFFQKQYRVLSSSINMLNPGRDHKDQAINIDTFVKEWIPIPINQDRKKAFLHAGISPQDALIEPMKTWTVEDINVYEALNREALPC